MTPLMMAVAVDAPDSFAFLLERGADPAVWTLSGNTIILTAAAHGRLATMASHDQPDRRVVHERDTNRNTPSTSPCRTAMIAFP